MDQIQQRKIEIIDNVYITKLLKSDDLNENYGEGVALAYEAGAEFGRYGDGPVSSYRNGLARESIRHSGYRSDTW